MMIPILTAALLYAVGNDTVNKVEYMINCENIIFSQFIVISRYRLTDYYKIVFHERVNTHMTEMNFRTYSGTFHKCEIKLSGL